MDIRSILIIFFVAFILFCIDWSVIEGMRAGRGAGRRGGGAGRRGGGAGRRGGGGGRRGVGCRGKACNRGGIGRARGSGSRMGRGYFRHRAPPFRKNRHQWRRGAATSIYDGTPYYWGGWRPIAPAWIYNYYPSWLYTAQCRRGCGYLGNGVVGCVNPTNSPDSCIFASDCYGC